MPPTRTTTAAQLVPGTEVEVRTQFLETWARGFEIASIDGDHARVRRRSDGVQLPVTIPVERLRRGPHADATDTATKPRPGTPDSSSG